jgi:hypothetical protein
MSPVVSMTLGTYSSRTRIAVCLPLVGFYLPSLATKLIKFGAFAVSIAAVTISNSRRRLLTLSPNAFPAARFIAKREPGDETPIEYIQVWTIREGV